MNHFNERQQRWLAISLTTTLLAGGGLAAAGGNPLLALGIAVVAPFLAAGLSGRSLRGTLQAGVGGVFALWIVLGMLMLDSAGPGFPTFVGLLAAVVLRWNQTLHLVGRVVASPISGIAAWAFTSYSWDAHWLLVVAIPPVLAVGLVDEAVDLFVRGRQVSLGPDFLAQVSTGRRLAWAAWLSFSAALFSHMLQVGSPSLFVLIAVVAGFAGAAASFSAPPAEGEVRAVTFVLSITPPLIVVGAIGILLVLLAQSDEPWFG